MPLAQHHLAAFLCACLALLPVSSLAESARTEPRRTAEEKALIAIQEDAVRKVQALMTRMQGMPDGPAKVELERQIVAIKEQSEIEFLEAKVQYARLRGDEWTALEAERQLGRPRPAAATGGCVDSLDDNQTCVSAVPVIPRNYPALMVGIAPDEDWYRVSVQRNGTLTVTLSFTHANGNIDLRLYDACGGILLQSSSSLTNTEQITYKNSQVTRDLYVRVFMSSGSCNSYAMNVSITGADNAAATFTPAGWTAPTVPRSANNSTNASVPLPATLNGNGNTWLNAATNITGPDNIPAIANAIFLDDSLLQGSTISDNSVPGLWTGLNAGPHTIRGGRHTLRHEVDVNHQMIETFENDNSWSNQWVWSPLVTTFQSPNVRKFPPIQGTGVYRNADGTRYTRQPTFSWVIAMAPLTAGDDYDLRVYSDSATSTTGYTMLLRSSVATTNNIDFVVGHYNGTPTTVFPAVDRFMANHGDDYVLDQSDARLANGNLNTTPAFSWKPITLPPNRLADAYEAYMVAGNTYYFTLRILSGTTPIQFQIFPPSSGDVWRPGEGSIGSLANPQALTFTAISTGWHPIVVYRRTGTNAGTELIYDFEWSTTMLVDVPGEKVQPAFSLAHAVPNPVRDRSRIGYVLPSEGRVSLGVYDVSGRLVRVLADGRTTAGSHSIEWDGRATDGSRVAGGVYWARLQFGDRTLTRKLAVVR